MANPANSAAPSDQLRALYHHVANWRRHAEHIYGFAQTQMLEWPALSIDWLPDRKTVEDGRDYSLQYICTGTQALPGHQNYISVMEFALPLDRDDAEDFYHYEANENQDMETANPFEFRSVKGHSRLDQVTTVDGPVLRLRAMPQMTDIVAVKTTTGYISVFHLGRREKIEPEGMPPGVPDVQLKGHREAGFALGWHPKEAGTLASGSDDHQVLIWDIDGYTDDMGQKAESGIAPTHTYTHDGNVCGLDWHQTQEHILATTSEDHSCRLWDTRSSSSAVVIDQAHRGTAFDVSMHPTASFMFATVGGDRLLKLWDMRRTAAPTHSMFYHSNAITAVEWAPFADSVLATAGADRRVAFWDIAKMGQPAQDDGDAHCPPEMSFLHTGHLSRVTDIAWNPSLEDEWMVASSDMTNCLQIYRPLNEVVYDYQQTDAFDADTGEL